jgi:hypothetical protein
MSDVAPGEGRKATITGKTYDQICDAAHKVSDEYFEIRQHDKTRGAILAERTMSAWGAGAWVGIYITPAAAGAESYTVEVVRRKKLMTNVGEQDWEYKVLRDIYRLLGLPALEESVRAPGGDGGPRRRARRLPAHAARRAEGSRHRAGHPGHPHRRLAPEARAILSASDKVKLTLACS